MISHQPNGVAECVVVPLLVYVFSSIMIALVCVARLGSLHYLASRCVSFGRCQKERLYFFLFLRVQKGESKVCVIGGFKDVQRVGNRPQRRREETAVLF